MTTTEQISRAIEQLQAADAKLAAAKDAAFAISDPEASKTARRAARETWESERAAALSAMVVDADTLPALTGSEKQIAWADKLRAGVVEQWNRFEIINGWVSEYPQTHVEKMARVLDGFESIDAASFWIDNRSHDTIELMSGRGF